MTNRRPSPSYRHHKARGLAVVRIEGKDHYLGPYDSPESWEEYHRLVADYLSRKDVAPSPSFQGQPISVQRLCLAYTDFAEKYYVKDGEMTAEVVCITYALRRLIKLFGSVPAVVITVYHCHGMGNCCNRAVQLDLQNGIGTCDKQRAIRACRQSHDTFVQVRKFLLQVGCKERPYSV